MNTNYLVPIDDRARDILRAYHLAGCSENSDGSHWKAYRLHALRLEEISRAATGAHVALDQAEFELLGEPVPA